MSANYRVKDGIRVVLAGTAYSNGQTFTAELEDVRPMLDAGWIVPTEVKATARRTARTSS